MYRMILSLTLLIAASFIFTSCGAPAANNTASNNANKAANAANTAAAPAADKAAAEADVKKVLGDFAAALNKGDATELDKFYRDDYTLIDQNGSVVNKAARLESVKTGKVKFDGMKFEDLKINSNPAGDAAVVVGRVTGKNIVDGKTEERNSMVTWVVVKSKDKGWQFLNAQITDIKGGAAPAKADDKKADEKKSDDTKPAAPANK